MKAYYDDPVDGILQMQTNVKSYCYEINEINFGIVVSLQIGFCDDE